MRHSLQQRLLVACATLLTFASLAIADEDHEKIAATIKKIVAKEHSPKLKGEAMKIFPAARKYRAQLTIHEGGETHKIGPSEVSEKWVDGKYVVTSVDISDLGSVHIIIFFDEKTATYRKWALVPDAGVYTAIGTRAGASRTISWVGKAELPDGDVLTLSQEHYTDEKIVWSEVHIKNGKVTRRDEGVATVVKE